MTLRKVGPSGPPRARIMIVGEAPGRDETIQGEPFVGVAGKTLRQFLMMVGIDPQECFLTNICKYQPPANDLGAWFTKDGVPTKIVLEGLMELEQEIRSVQPNIIVAAGNFANWALTGQARWNKKERKFAGITQHRGSIYDCRIVPGVKVLATFHPSYISREGMQDHGIWLCDLERVKRESEFPETRRQDKELLLVNGSSVYQMQPRKIADTYKVELSESPWKRSVVRDWLLNDMQKTLTIDIEYIGSKLLCVGMTTERDRAVTLVIRSPDDLLLAQEILTSGIGLNAQNAAFEAAILEWHFGMKIMPFIVYDTMLAAHAANIELPKDLGFLTSIYTDQPYHKGMVDWNAVKKGNQDMSVLWCYNAIDVWTEHQIMEEQLKHDLDEPDVMAVFRHEMMLLSPLWEMSKRGIKVDVEKIEAIRKRLLGDPATGASGEIKRLQTVLDAFYGAPVNVKGRKELLDLLVKKLELTPSELTDSGLPALHDKALASMRLKAKNDQQRTIIDLIRDIRKKRDMVSKFLDIELDSDNRFRSHYNPGGTDTGRLSSAKFYPTGKGDNGQNRPSDSEARSVYIADDGYEFAYADLMRAESMVVAYLTNDPAMLLDHSPGQNAHKNLGAKLFNKTPEEINDDEYFLSKKTRHAGNYLQGPRTFMMNVNQLASKTGVSITFAQAKHFIGTYREVHPFLENWWNATEQELWASRTLFNLLGRRRIFYGHIRSILPNAVAYVPQSTVGDILNVGLLSISNVCAPYLEKLGIWEEYATIAWELQHYDVQLLNQVHDAIGYQYPIRYREEVNSRIMKLLSIPITVPKTYETFRIPVEIKYGRSWGEAKTEFKPE
jgi:uracil-DNA glycosylase family 4